MEKFTFRNANGKSVIIGGHHDDYLLTAHSGTTSAEILTTSRKGYAQNGQTFVKNNLGIRIITLEFSTRRFSDYSFYKIKRELSAIFNPLLGNATLVYKNDYIEKQITVSVTGMVELTEKSKIIGKYAVELTAFNPFWEDIEETSIAFASFTGGLTYPITFQGENITFALKGMSAKINIDSDVETPITAIFEGACVNPVFTNTTTGERISIQTSITEGEQIIVTTGYGIKNVVKIDSKGKKTNVNNYITDDSSFFQLLPGSNSLKFDASTGTPEITLKYKNLYTGV